MTPTPNPGITGLTDFSLIGTGGFAVVYSATEIDSGRQVAVKVLNAVDAASRRRFDREWRTMGQAGAHPHIVSLFRTGFTEPDQRPYLVMEYLGGGSLQDHIDHGQTVEWSAAVELIAPIAAALQHAHARGVVHKDVKPANILMAETGEVKLADFGIAAVRDATSSTNSVAYSLAFTAPETFDAQDAQDATVDRRDQRSDLYSLAATLYALGRGRAPFASASSAGLMGQVLTAPVPSVDHGGLDWFFSYALAKDPAQRYQSADQFMAGLRDALAHGATSTTAPPPLAAAGDVTLPGLAPSALRPDQPGASRGAKRPWIWAAVATIAVLIGASVAVIAAQRTDTPDGPTETTSATQAPTSDVSSGDNGGDDGAEAAAPPPEPAPPAQAAAPTPTPPTQAEAAPPPATTSFSPGEDCSAPPADAGLRMGLLLPETGALNFLGASTIPGVELAVCEINAAGGVNGEPIALFRADTETDADAATDATAQLIADDVDAVIGPLTSTVGFSVSPLLAEAAVVHCSPTNSAVGLGVGNDDRFAFRVSPSDDLQAAALADLVLSDGHTRAAVVVRNDDYGESYREEFSRSFRALGGEIVFDEAFDPLDPAGFDDLVADVALAQPDAVLLVAFDEGADILGRLINADSGPPAAGLYVNDSLAFDGLGDLVDASRPGVVEAVRGVRGSATPELAGSGFTAAFEQYAPAQDPLFSAFAFDCAVLMALAAQAAGSNEPAAIRDAMVGVSRGGTPCRSFGACVELLAAGDDIDYEGASGPIDLTQAGEPGGAIYDIIEFDASGSLVVIEQRPIVGAPG